MDVLLSTNSSGIIGIIPASGSTQAGNSASSSKRSDNTRANSSTQDTVNLSPEGQRASQEAIQSEGQSEKSANTEENSLLTPEEQQLLQELKIRDREVRIHEQAHLAAAGQYAAGGPSFTYQQGPDGNRYAIGGEVPIDVSKEATPEATIQKMNTVRQAAMAPAEPSNADRQIAAQAAMTLAQARQELTAQNSEFAEENSTTNTAEGVESSDPRSASENTGNEPVATVGGTTPQAMISAYQAMQALD